MHEEALNEMQSTCDIQLYLSEKVGQRKKFLKRKKKKKCV